MKFFRPFFVVPLRQKHATVKGHHMIFIYLFIIFLKRVYIGDWESDCDWDWRKKKQKKL